MAARGSRVVIPHELIDVNERQRIARRIDEARVLVDELADLAASWRGVIEQQIEQITRAVLKLDFQRPVLAQAAFNIDRALPVRLRNNQHIQVPRHRMPMAVRMMIKHLVPAFADIDVADDPVHTAKRVIRRQIEIVAPPLERLRAAVATPKTIPVRRGDGLSRSLVALVAVASLDLVNVAIRQAAFIEKPAVSVLDVQVQTPQISVVLRVARAGRRLLGIINHAKMHKVRRRRQAASQTVQLEADRLLHAGHAPVDRHPRRGAAVEIDRLFRLRVPPAVIVSRLQTACPVEIQSPLVLAGNIR